MFYYLKYYIVSMWLSSLHGSSLLFVATAAYVHTETDFIFSWFIQNVSLSLKTADFLSFWLIWIVRIIVFGSIF